MYIFCLVGIAKWDERGETGRSLIPAQASGNDFQEGGKQKLRLGVKCTIINKYVFQYI